MAHALSKVAEGIANYLATFKSAPASIRKKVTRVQADAFIRVVSQSRLLKVEADEIKVVTVTLLDKCFSKDLMQEIHQAIDKAAVILDCCIPVPVGRRPMQDYTCMVVYFSNDQISKVVKLRSESSANVMTELQHELSNFLVCKLGLRCPSEMTTAVLCAAVGLGDPQWESYSPAVLHQLYKSCKTSLSRCISTAPAFPQDVDYITRLPSSPLNLPSGWYAHAYPEGWDCHATSTTTAQVVAAARKVPCRSTCKAISHPYMPKPNGMFGSGNDGASNMEGFMMNMMKMMMTHGLQMPAGGKQPEIVQMLGNQRGQQLSTRRLKALEDAASSSGDVPRPPQLDLPPIMDEGTAVEEVPAEEGQEDFDDYMKQVELLEESRGTKPKKLKKGKGAKAKAKAKAAPKAKATPKAKAKAKGQPKAKAAPVPVQQDSAGAVPTADEARPLITRLENGTYLGLPATQAERVRLWPAGCGKCRKQPGCAPSCWYYRNHQ